GAAEWPAELGDRRRRMHRRLRRLLAGLHADIDRVNAAVIDIPYAVVRRHLLNGAAIPPSADAIVADCARALIPRN
ncbi:MAG TPA: TetR/AcrR family transcriptional regulator, partial [Mycobacterium sp.]|nr:TetR/AcrR family transcriptional regulator [Mycobacterium sp.]